MPSSAPSPVSEPTVPGSTVSTPEIRDVPEWVRRAYWTWKAMFPTWALALLMGIGIVDLVSTAVLHRAGLVTEVNPIMRFFIVRSEWLFAFAKGLTLGAAWGAMAWYARTDLKFVKKACLIGSAAYVALWCVWFFRAQ